MNKNKFNPEKLLPNYVLFNVLNIVGIDEIIPAEMIVEEPFPIP
jgi:hypothetical protein